ncbi:hypothetical protein HIM_03231 [Hirsutella minnesotensis 3608]|nr:hypothetical protein HIM_03231 [Hirsutella minnesotensis 3608]
MQVPTSSPSPESETPMPSRALLDKIQKVIYEIRELLEAHKHDLPAEVRRNRALAGSPLFRALNLYLRDHVLDEFLLKYPEVRERLFYLFSCRYSYLERMPVAHCSLGELPSGLPTPQQHMAGGHSGVFEPTSFERSEQIAGHQSLASLLTRITPPNNVAIPSYQPAHDLKKLLHSDCERPLQWQELECLEALLTTTNLSSMYQTAVASLDPSSDIELELVLKNLDRGTSEDDTASVSPDDSTSTSISQLDDASPDKETQQQLLSEVRTARAWDLAASRYALDAPNHESGIRQIWEDSRHEPEGARDDGPPSGQDAQSAAHMEPKSAAGASFPIYADETERDQGMNSDTGGILQPKNVAENEDQLTTAEVDDPFMPAAMWQHRKDGPGNAKDRREEVHGQTSTVEVSAVSLRPSSGDMPRQPGATSKRPRDGGFLPLNPNGSRERADKYASEDELSDDERSESCKRPCCLNISARYRKQRASRGGRRPEDSDDEFLDNESFSDWRDEAEGAQDENEVPGQDPWEAFLREPWYDSEDEWPVEALERTRGPRDQSQRELPPRQSRPSPSAHRNTPLLSLEDRDKWVGPWQIEPEELIQDGSVQNPKEEAVLGNTPPSGQGTHPYPAQSIEDHEHLEASGQGATKEPIIDGSEQNTNEDAYLENTPPSAQKPQPESPPRATRIMPRRRVEQRINWVNERAGNANASDDEEFLRTNPQYQEYLRLTEQIRAQARARRKRHIERRRANARSAGGETAQQEQESQTPAPEEEQPRTTAEAARPWWGSRLMGLLRWRRQPRTRYLVLEPLELTLDSPGKR